MPSNDDEPRAHGQDHREPGAQYRTLPADQVRSFPRRHKMLVAAAVIALAIAVITAGVLDPIALLDIGLGANLAGLIAILAVAGWKYGRRRN